MAEPPTYPTPNSDTSDDIRARPGRRATTRLPGWVKVFVVIAIVLIVLFVILHLTGNGFGDHMHMSIIDHGVPQL